MRRCLSSFSSDSNRGRVDAMEWISYRMLLALVSCASRSLSNCFSCSCSSDMFVLLLLLLLLVVVLVVVVWGSDDDEDDEEELLAVLRKLAND